MENMEESKNCLDVSDIFESSINLDNKKLQEGYNDGYHDGLVSEKDEWTQVGLKNGFDVGEEIGLYSGCVDIWESAIRVDPEAFTERVQKGVKRMGELLQTFPLMDPENKALQEIMDALRLKFRVITASLAVKIEYGGYHKEEKAMDF